MLSEHDTREIKEYEKRGLNVVVIGSDGTLKYSSNDINNDDFCDHCSAFRLLPDPDPYDWFRDGDMKAVCLDVNGVIEGSLEKPSEMVNIMKPLYCPRLGRELTEEEKQTATEQLKLAQKRMQ